MIYEECGDHRLQHCSRSSFFIFLLMFRRIHLYPKGIIHHIFSPLGFAVSEELGNKQTHKLTDYPIDLEEVLLTSFQVKPQMLMTCPMCTEKTCKHAKMWFAKAWILLIKI